MRALASGQVPGAILFVRQGDRSYSVAVGYADEARRIRMRADAAYPIGSTTKSYTAVLVMRLVAQGRVALNAPVSTYLPDLVPNAEHITIRDLLSHTSGLYNYTDDPDFRAPYVSGDLRHVWTPRQLVGFAIAHPPLFPPGTRFSYSNTNFVVLGLVVERVGGASYGRQLRDYILRPLGLKHTTFPTDSATLPEVHGYASLAAYGGTDSTPMDVTAFSPSYAWSAGAIRATVQEVAGFYRGLLSGKLLPARQVAAMKTTTPEGWYGLGLARSGSPVLPVRTSCGTAWGHGGSFIGYHELPLSSGDGTRQAVLVLNADPLLMTSAQTAQMSKLVATAYCRGVHS